MKTTAIKLFCCACLLLVFVSACKKSDNNNTSSSFTWTWNGNNYTAVFKEAYIESNGPTSTIVGGIESSTFAIGSGPSIRIPSLNVGVYRLLPTINNNLSFFTPTGNLLQAIDGTLNITRNSNNKLSGDFSATLTDGISQTSLSGAFVNITINL